jgi:hypothetical protein
MIIVGKTVETTNAGYPCVGTNDNTFNTSDATRWGLLAEHGRRGYILVAECYGSPIAVQVSRLNGDQKQEMTALRKLLVVDGRALGAIRSERVSGIVWDTSGAYV